MTNPNEVKETVERLRGQARASGENIVLGNMLVEAADQLEALSQLPERLGRSLDRLLATSPDPKPGDRAYQLATEQAADDLAALSSALGEGGEG